MEPAPAPDKQVLTQSDVEGLLSQVNADSPAGPALVPSEAGPVERTVQPYDFRQPAFLSAKELRKLRLWHESFIRALSSRLTMFLRMEVVVTMSKLQTLSYQKFTENLPNPTYLTLFKAEPMRGICIMETPMRLGLTMVDRMLGGTAQPPGAHRDLSDIEAGLLDQALMLLLSEWCNHWAHLQEVRPVLLGHETNSRFLQTAAHDTIMLLLAMEMRLGDCTEEIQLGFPYYTLEPLVTRLSQNIDQAASDSTPVRVAPLTWKKHLDDAVIPITAEWTGLEMTVEQVARLKVGDVLPLAPDAANHVRLRLANLPKFFGRLGTRDKAWAVEATQIISS